MQFHKLLAALGAVALTVTLASGCTSTPDHYGVVKAHPKDKTPIADWESKAVTVSCERDEYAVYKTEDKKSQLCYEPAKTTKMTPVNDWSLINNPKYWCGS